MRHVLLLTVLLLSTPVLAQTSTAELDKLFARLRDPATGSEVLRIEPLIWDLWMHAGTKDQNEKLAKAAAAMGVSMARVHSRFWMR